MSDSKISTNYHAGCRKKKIKKRQATSPLTDNGLTCVNTSELKNNNREQRKGLAKKGRQECSNTQSVSGFYDYSIQNMAFQQQQGHSVRCHKCRNHHLRIARPNQCIVTIHLGFNHLHPRRHGQMNFLKK